MRANVDQSNEGARTLGPNDVEKEEVLARGAIAHVFGAARGQDPCG